jgi:hypothetical protein
MRKSLSEGRFIELHKAYGFGYTPRPHIDLFGKSARLLSSTRRNLRSRGLSDISSDVSESSGLWH